MSAVITYTAISSGRRFVSRLSGLNPISHATRTSDAWTPSDARTENQTERYSRIPSNVVYQETMDNRTLATKRALTMGRLTPARSVGMTEDTLSSLCFKERDT